MSYIRSLYEFLKYAYRTVRDFIIERLQRLPDRELTFIFMLIVFLLELFFIFRYYYGYWYSAPLVFPYNKPLLLIYSFMTWCFVWGFSAWRRALHGRFTRGDRRLWYKALASFWIFELSTILGIYLSACWMSWGPIIFIPRNFLMKKKSFIFEFTMFTYIVWLSYILRLGMRWLSHIFQVAIASAIVTVVIMMLYRDFLILYLRECIDVEVGFKYRNQNARTAIYSLSESWWCNHYMGNRRDYRHNYLPLALMLFGDDKIVDKIGPLFTEYELYNWYPYARRDQVLGFKYRSFVTVDLLSYMVNYTLLDGEIWRPSQKYTIESGYFGPRQIGFIPKRFAIWTLLFIIKAWHHFMLLLWWSLLFFKLISCKKASYAALNACNFNVYCCFFICWLVFSMRYWPAWEWIFRIKPIVRTSFQNKNIITEGLTYGLLNFIGEKSYNHPKDHILSNFLSYSERALTYYFTHTKGLDILDADVLRHIGINR